MAKYKRKYYTKKKVLKAITNYQRRKLNYITDLHWNSDGNLFIDGEQKNAFIIGEALLGNTNEFQTLGKQYAFVKLRGIRIEACHYGIGNAYDYGICIGNANDSIAFGNLRTQPNILLLNTNGKSSKYVKISSQFTSTNSIELFNNVALIPFRQGSGVSRWALQITLYLTFKTTT